jgi:tetratricopeptide (TPR) repeat protein
MVRQADSQAVALLHEAVAAFGQVLEAGQPRADALVCAGNALSTCAEVAARGDVAAALPLLEQAAGAYEAALRREEDALTWSNLADALVQHASLCCEAGLARQAQPLFSRAMHAYQRCCSLSDALAGDDLPGLLCNWSRGLLAAAQQAQVWAAGAVWGSCSLQPAVTCPVLCGQRCGPAPSPPPPRPAPSPAQLPACLPAPLQDPSLVLSLLGEAEQRLQRSIDFLRGSDEPLLALGDVLLERGERLAAAGDTAAASHALQRALGEGYQAVQRISARSPEAAVGVADVHVQAARLAAAGGQAAQAAEHWAAAEAGYRAALQQPTAFDFRERSDMRYNHACCLSRCGRHSEAAALLRQLVAVGGASEADARQDGDLQGVVL